MRLRASGYLVAGLITASVLAAAVGVGFGLDWAVKEYEASRKDRASHVVKSEYVGTTMMGAEVYRFILEDKWHYALVQGNGDIVILPPGPVPSNLKCEKEKGAPGENVDGGPKADVPEAPAGGAQRDTQVSP